MNKLALADGGVTVEAADGKLALTGTISVAPAADEDVMVLSARILSCTVSLGGQALGGPVLESWASKTLAPGDTYDFEIEWSYGSLDAQFAWPIQVDITMQYDVVVGSAVQQEIVTARANVAPGNATRSATFETI